MHYINFLLDTYNIPILTAFLLGTLTSLSPCPLTTNITAIAYIAKDTKTPKKTLLSGIFYTLGLGASYTTIASFIYLGLSSFRLSWIFQGWGEKILGPLLIVISLIMFGAIKINLLTKGEKIERAKEWLSTKGHIGTFLLGMLFALAFCPYSSALYFGAFIPLVLKSNLGLFLPPVFALGTGLPVIIFSFLLAYSMNAVGRAFKRLQQMEKIMRYAVAAVFLLIGIYYLKNLIT